MRDELGRPRCAICGGPVARFTVWYNQSQYTQIAIAERHGRTERHELTMRQAREIQDARREGRLLDFVAFVSSPGAIEAHATVPHAPAQARDGAEHAQGGGDAA